MGASPWTMLALLALARSTIGYVYQSIGSAGPAIAADLAIEFALVGTLIGIFMLPGIVLSLPSGLLATRRGDKPLMLVGLALTTVGGLVTALADGFVVAAIGRLVTGVGFTAASFFFVKATLDWFAAQRGLPLAMAVLLNSWPLGIGLGLATQGELTLLFGWRTMVMLAGALPVVAAVMLLVLYRDPPARTAPAGGALAALRRLTGREWSSMLLLSVVWSVLNVGLILVFGFAPALLHERGVDLAAAGWLVSVGNWVGIAALAAGGALVSRIGHAPPVIAVATAATAVVFWAMAAVPEALWVHVVFGIVGFAAAGPIMAQPAHLVRDEVRGAAMGVFYTLFYVFMAVGPAVAGLLRDRYDPAAPLYLGCALMLLSLLCQAILARHRAVRPRLA